MLVLCSGTIVEEFGGWYMYIWGAQSLKEILSQPSAWMFQSLELKWKWSLLEPNKVTLHAVSFEWEVPHFEDGRMSYAKMSLVFMKKFNKLVKFEFKKR